MVLEYAGYPAEDSCGPNGEYQFVLKLRVDCVAGLWTAAAQHCMRVLASAEDEIIELIGPKEDPSIEDCLTILALPPLMPGCAMLDVSIDRALPRIRTAA